MGREVCTSHRCGSSGGNEGASVNAGLYSVAVTAYKRAFISEALRQHKGNVCRTARALGLHRNSLWTAMRSVGIKPGDFRGGTRWQ